MKHDNLKFQVGDRVRLVLKHLIQSDKPYIGNIEKIDKRRIRPYSVSGFVWHYAEKDLVLIFDYNDILKEMLDKP